MRTISNSDRSRFLTRPRLFSPLSVNPYFSFDARSGVLKTGGLPAGYFDLASTFTSQATGTNAGSDATQGTSGSQPVYLAHTAGANYLHLPGVAGNYASTPDSAAWLGMGDFTMDWEGYVIETTGADNQTLISSYTGASNFIFFLDTTGKPYFQPDAGTASVTAITNQNVKYRAIRSGSDLRFFEDIGSGWQQVGAAVVWSGSFGGGSPVEIGCWGTSNWKLRGKTTRVRIWNTATPDISTPVLDINFAAVPHRATSFVCATGQTVTINSTGNNPATVIGIPTVRPDGVDDAMAGTASIDLDTERIVSVYTVNSTGVRGVRSTLVSASPIIFTTGTAWTIFSGVAYDTEYAIVIPAAADDTQLVAHLVSTFGAADLT